MALQNHLELSDIVKTFEERTIKPLEDKRTKLFEMMQDSYTEEAKVAYEKLEMQVLFFQGMIDTFRKVMRFDAVLVDGCDKLIEAYEAGNSAEMIKRIEKIKEVIK